MERIDGSVRLALRSSGVPDSGTLALVTRAWPAAVGPAISRAAWPLRLSRDGTLHVATTSSTWAFELGRMEAEIRERLRRAIGAETPPALRFAPGLVPAPPASQAAPRAPLSPTPEELSAATVTTSAIEDLELREAVRRAVAASLARDRIGRIV